MSDHNKNNYFEDFSGISKDQWKEQIVKDLKGADYNEKLVLKTEEGFDIQPFYHAEDIEALDLPYTGWYAEATENSLSPRQWENRVSIDVYDETEANKKALLALENGADGILFILKKTIEKSGLDKLLQNVLMEYCAISYVVDQPLVAFSDLLVDYVKNNQYPSDKITGSIAADITKLTQEELKQYLSNLSGFTNYQPLVIEATQVTNASGMVGFILSEFIQLIDLLNEVNINTEAAIRKIALSIPSSNDYFRQIAVVRALRMLLDLIVKQYGVDSINPSLIKIHVSTKVLVDESTKEDPYKNMLSNASQAMASIIGGCNVLTVIPHNKGIEEVGRFAERIARNVSNVLREESYLDKVADPSSGSYYIETLTNQIAENSWQECQKLLKV